MLRGIVFAIFGLVLLAAPTLSQQTDPQIQDTPEAQDTPENTVRPLPGSVRALNSKTLFSPPAASPEDRQFLAFFEGAPPQGGQGFPSGALSGAGVPKALAGRNHDFWFQPNPTLNVAFTGLDVTERDRYFSAGFKRAVRGHLEEPGFRFMATFGAKIRDYDPSLGGRENRLHALRILGGHEWHVASLTVGVMAGGSFTLNSTDATLKTRRAGRFGTVGMVDLWQDWGKPDAAFGSRYTALFAMVDQASRSSHVRLRHGFQLVEAPWRLGPEAAYSTGESQSRRGVPLQGGWRKARLGAHLSEVPLRAARLALSAGAEWRHDHKPGAYMQLSAYMRY